MCPRCSGEELAALTLGEIRGWRAAWLRRHIRTCGDCGAEQVTLMETAAAARAVQTGDASGFLQARIWSRIESAGPTISRTAPAPVRIREPRRVSLGFRLGLMAAGAAIFSALLLPSRTPSRMSAAAEIRQAVSRVNTWHLKGWKLQNGKQTIWEVWGRRSPFFYREQVGEDVVIDDGKRRVSAYAPLDSRSGGRSTGIFLIGPSLQGGDNVRWSYARLVNQWNGDLRPMEQTASEAIYNFPESGIFNGGAFDSATDLLYYVSLRTRLPVHYEARLGMADRKQRIAMLDAEFNRAIPVREDSLDTDTSGYSVLDATKPFPVEQNMASENGITVRANPLLVGPDGQVLLRVRAWFGSIPLNDESPVRVNMNAMRWAGSDGMTTPANVDDRNRAYTQVGWDRLRTPRDRSGALMLMTPVDPLPSGASAPARLTVQLTVAPQMDTRLNGTLGMADGQLSRQVLTLTIPLPHPSVSVEQGVLRYVMPLSAQAFSPDLPETLISATDLARGRFYGAYIDTRNPDRPHLNRAVDYYEAYFRDSPSATNVALVRYFTADICRSLGEPSRARKMLQDVLDDKRLDALYRDAGRNLPDTIEAEQRRKYVEETHKIMASYRRNAAEALDKLSHNR